MVTEGKVHVDHRRNDEQIEVTESTQDNHDTPDNTQAEVEFDTPSAPTPVLASEVPVVTPSELPSVPQVQLYVDLYAPSVLPATIAATDSPQAILSIMATRQIDWTVTLMLCLVRRL